MKNKNGFTLVELLAVIVILGILSLIAVIAYTRYLEQTRTKTYDMLASNVSDAAINYLLDYPATTSVSITTLVNDNYMERPQSPYDKSSTCTGKVTFIKTAVSSSDDHKNLTTNDTEVLLCCSSNYYSFKFPQGTKTKKTSCS